MPFSFEGFESFARCSVDASRFTTARRQRDIEGTALGRPARVLTGSKRD
jgi:hypothetical protein